MTFTSCGILSYVLMKDNVNRVQLELKANCTIHLVSTTRALRRVPGLVRQYEDR